MLKTVDTDDFSSKRINPRPVSLFRTLRSLFGEVRPPSDVTL
jgi:hypothetical protein